MARWPDRGLLSRVPRIALATYAKLPTLNDDDRLLIPALAALGVTAVPAVWDSGQVCWDGFQGGVIRSCWDYHLRPSEFLEWIARLERGGVTVWNPAALLRWNHHKHYLRDLAAPRARRAGSLGASRPASGPCSPTRDGGTP